MTEKKCSICGSETTSMEKVTWTSRKTGEVKSTICAHWYGTEDTPMCKKCQVRMKWRENHKVPADTECECCHSKTTRMDPRFGMSAWKKTETGYICWSCHITEVNKTRVLSPESLERMAEAQRGKKLGDVTKAKMSEAHAGEKNAFFGRKHSDESIEKMSAAKQGEKHNFYGIKRPEHGEKIRGEKNPNWKGGIWTNELDLLTERIRNTAEYKHWRLEVFSRDGYTCRACGDDHGNNLEAHHIHPLVVILSENEITTTEQAKACEILWDVDNGLTLCNPCHRIEEYG